GQSDVDVLAVDLRSLAADGQLMDGSFVVGTSLKEVHIVIASGAFHIGELQVCGMGLIVSGGNGRVSKYTDKLIPVFLTVGFLISFPSSHISSELLERKPGTLVSSTTNVICS